MGQRNYAGPGSRRQRQPAPRPQPASLANFLQIGNNGALIDNTNFWQTEMATRGFYYLSRNAGVERLLVPDCHLNKISEMKTGQYVIMTRGPSVEGLDSLEIMFEDHSNAPYRLEITCQGQVDMLPTPGQISDFTIWTRNGIVHTTQAHYRRASSIPCMAPL
jgi:hypothetical protein